VLGAKILDGLGNPAFNADIGIRENRFACIGKIDPESARQLIDGTGLTAAPGFIDVHTHVERNVPNAAPFIAQNFVRQGVTTLITGNCGRSFLDISKVFIYFEIQSTF